MNSSTATPRTAAIIVAAGQNTRMPGEIPKAYRMLAGKPVVEYSIKLFTKHPAFSAVVLVYNPQHLSHLKQVLVRYPKVITVEGGANRQQSVFRGLLALQERHVEQVMIHDAARPFVKVELVNRLLKSLTREQAVVPALSIRETVKEIGRNQYVQKTANRDLLCAVQTPQAFDYSLICSLHEKFQKREATDDATLAEWKKIPVKLIEGDLENVKLTYPEDLIMAQRQFAQAEFRSGMGYDVHKLVPHDDHTPDKRRVLRLCGIDIHCRWKLEGHSDADVGLHALTDAILGAMAEGDIGEHFPASEPQWRGADSRLFLLEAKKLMQKRKAELVNADITLLAQQPRISPHRDEMRGAIARILDVPLGAVSIKATTTEGLGFVGREEGIAAQAVVTLRLTANE